VEQAQGSWSRLARAGIKSAAPDSAKYSGGTRSGQLQLSFELDNLTYCRHNYIKWSRSQAGAKIMCLSKFFYITFL
jgi:hypothetical protein